MRTSIIFQKGRIIGLIITCFIVFGIISCQDNSVESTRKPTAASYRVESATYISSVVPGASRQLNICLPSNYQQLRGPLPVLYLLHGAVGNESSWIEGGQIVHKLSTLYKQGAIFPLIVVTPANMAMGSNYRAVGPVGPGGDRYVQEFVDDLIPFIEANYKASSQREDRALAGLSAGGIQTLNLGLFFPEKFGYVYPLSTGYSEEGADTLRSGYYDAVLNNPEINRFKKFTLYCGANDEIFYNTTDPENTLLGKTLKIFDDHDIHYQAVIDAGYIHSWAYWQLCFDRFIQAIFVD